ncbi:MAG: hypothetical protein ABJB03_01240 [Rhodoglobus sp.]
MTHRERTLQQLDPLGGMAVRTITILGAIGIVIFAIAQTFANARDIDFVGLAIVAIVVVAACAAVLIYSSSPLRAPMNRTVHLLAMGLAMLALVLNAGSMWRSNELIQDDWGPSVVGVVSLVLAVYRPARELAVVGSFAALFTGFLALLQVHSLQSPVPPFVFVIVAVTPVLALSLAGAMFVRVSVTTLVRWQSRADRAARRLADRSVEGIARSVQQDRVTILNRDVVPFFAEVLTRASITDEDRARASQIADSIRRVMVADVDRSWLDVVVEQAAGARDRPGAEAVQDPERLASAMNTDQRTATRAMIVTLFEHQGFDPDGFDVTIERDGDEVVGTIRADVIRGTTTVRSDLAPYLAVFRVLFRDLEIDYSASTVRIRFAYDRQ